MTTAPATVTAGPGRLVGSAARAKWHARRAMLDDHEQVTRVAVREAVGRAARPPTDLRAEPTTGPGAAHSARGAGESDGRRRPPTAAERRAAEVAARRGPRPPRDPAVERGRIEERTVEQWIDETAIRAEAAHATARARSTPKRSRARGGRATVAPETAAEIGASGADARHAAKLVEQLGAAGEAFDRDRVDEARRLVAPLLKQLPSVAAVHELAGLIAYRSGRWRQAVTELEAAQALAPSMELLPVLADAYRAQRRWSQVDRIWADVRDASPAPDVMAEARIVAAGAQADRGDLAGALRTMRPATSVPRRVRDHHLRQWYVLGDLHDRVGDPIEASRWFALVAQHDRDFVDVVDRLRSLGR